MIAKIISGGQTGAERAGLDAALALHLGTGGWIPRGRRTEAGPLSPEDMQRYHLLEHISPSYATRTELNIVEANGTMIAGSPDSPGSALAVRLCQKHTKPCLILNTIGNDAPLLVRWLRDNKIRVLNVAGNRESKNPGIYHKTFALLMEALSR